MRCEGAALGVISVVLDNNCLILFDTLSKSIFSVFVEASDKTWLLANSFRFI